MSSTFHGRRLTPKQLAALLLLEKLEELPADWTPDNLPGPPNDRERRLVIEQIEHYKVRLRRLLCPKSASREYGEP